MEIREWARLAVQQRKREQSQRQRQQAREKRLKRLNMVLVPWSCVVSLWIAWEVWRAVR